MITAMAIMPCVCFLCAPPRIQTPFRLCSKSVSAWQAAEHVDLCMLRGRCRREGCNKIA